ncbi:MAG: kinase/pyrophosphorylase, partial [Sedimenticola sp.]|nr:kinase/pyrophosphorylase [Sedimenticola sp.]
PPRLNRIREERRPGSEYASLARCSSEVRQALQLFKKHNVWVLDTTTHSIEEVSSRIVKAIRSRK